MVTETQIKDAIGIYRDPYLGMDLGSAKAIQKCEVQNNKITIDVNLGFPAARYAAEFSLALAQHVQQALKMEVDIRTHWKIVAHGVQQGQQAHPQIKNIIAVASGKGGVGKSTVAVNMALALKAEGAMVGILDADIYGPSQPLMLGTGKQQPEPGKAPKKVLPILSPQGIYSMSIGYWVDEEQPMIWRGPMVSTALQQLLNDTEWPALDYLIVDLPPGTGDIQLTLAQKIPVVGAVIVTTPQDIAVLDARKAYGMLRKVGITVLGVVENMAYYHCAQCGHEDAIFGEGGGTHMAEQYGIPLLGKLPLDAKIRQQADSGLPTVSAEPDSELAQGYFRIARKVAAQLSLQPRNYGQLFGKVEVE
jgi:ATP-binding protein involved in chromosome partitioning